MTRCTNGKENVEADSIQHISYHQLSSIMTVTGEYIEEWVCVLIIVKCQTWNVNYLNKHEENMLLCY